MDNTDQVSGQCDLFDKLDDAAQSPAEIALQSKLAFAERMAKRCANALAYFTAVKCSERQKWWQKWAWRWQIVAIKLKLEAAR